jgi:hypothetical protein
MFSNKEKKILSLLSTNYSEYWDEYYLEPGERITCDKSFFVFHSYYHGETVFYTLHSFLYFYLDLKREEESENKAVKFKISIEDVEIALELIEEEYVKDLEVALELLEEE